MPLLGNSLPGYWRPFNTDSPWNRALNSRAAAHEESAQVMPRMRSTLPHLAISREYTPPIWVIDHTRTPKVRIRSDRVHDFFREGDFTRAAPFTAEMWPEQTPDAHIVAIDPYVGYAWEASRYAWGDPPRCTTYNEWALGLDGCGDSSIGERWTARGGRGSGVPAFAGVRRPEEFEYGVIRSASCFTFPECRRDASGSKIFVEPPACRSDGESIGAQYPIQGRRFQLDPTADEGTFDRWGLRDGARIWARGLQSHGMILVDRGGAMKLQVQLLSKNKDEHKAIWDQRVPGLYADMEKIPMEAVSMVEDGITATVKKG